MNPNAAEWTPSWAKPQAQPAPQPQPVILQRGQQIPPAQPRTQTAPSVSTAPVKKTAAAGPTSPKSPVASSAPAKPAAPAPVQEKPKPTPAPQPSPPVVNSPEQELPDDILALEVGELKLVDDKEVKRALLAEQLEEAAADEDEALLAEHGDAAAEEVEEEIIAAPGQLKKPVNVVFIGHVDSGKSTCSGQILYQTGMLDERTLAKFDAMAKEKGRQSWKFAWALDITDDEREKGKTQDCGRAIFETANKRFTILDAPGHRSFIPHMIGGASQADMAILIISAKKGEFEAGFDRTGSTREHIVLAKTAGVRQLIIAINKMDDPTVEYSKERYDECVDKVLKFTKQCGWNPKEITLIPISALAGDNFKTKCEAMPWYEGAPLLVLLDEMKAPERLFESPLRMPIVDKYKEMGCTVVIGKIESGIIKKGDQLVIMPYKTPVEVLSVLVDTYVVERGEPGDNVRVKVKGIEEDYVHCGNILCPPTSLVNTALRFVAQIFIMEHKTIITAGYNSVMHMHSIIEECILEELLAVVDKKTNEVTQKLPKFVKPGQTVRAVVSISSTFPLCMETYKDFPQLGRFMLRDEGQTVGLGVVLKLLSAKVPKEQKEKATTAGITE